MRTKVMDRRTEALRHALLESLLIRYEYRFADATFILVTDHADKDPGSDRAFLRLTFTGVNRFVREPGTSRPYRDVVMSYSTSHDTGAVVIQGVGAGGNGVGTSRVTLHFGSSFGDVSFSYESVVGHVRSARVVRSAEAYRYFDAETGEPFDFGSPFRDVLDRELTGADEPSFE